MAAASPSARSCVSGTSLQQEGPAAVVEAAGLDQPVVDEIPKNTRIRLSGKTRIDHEIILVEGVSFGSWFEVTVVMLGHGLRHVEVPRCMIDQLRVGAVYGVMLRWDSPGCEHVSGLAAATVLSIEFDLGSQCDAWLNILRR